MVNKTVLAMVSVFLAGCHEIPDAKPTEEQKFVGAFRTAFENRDVKGIESLVYWNEVPDDLKQDYLARIKAVLALSGNLPVRGVSLEPIKEESAKKEILIHGRAAELHPPATHLLRVELTGKSNFPGGSASGNVEFPVGVVDHKIVICSQVWVKTDTDR